MTYWIIIKGREYYKGHGLYTTNRDMAMRFNRLEDAEYVASAIQGRVVKY